MSQGTKRLIVAGIAILLIALAVWQVGQRRAGLERVTDLTSIDQLQTAFNHDAGRPRLILLLSPT